MTSCVGRQCRSRATQLGYTCEDQQGNAVARADHNLQQKLGRKERHFENLFTLDRRAVSRASKR